MRKVIRLIRSFYHLLLPVVVLTFVAALAASIWLVYTVSTPPRSAHLVTPARFAQLSSRGAQITDETWQNEDGSAGRGWLLKGGAGAPAVILLHRYGTDRSHILNFGVKLSETTNFTVLMPDLRGHGLEPSVDQTTFSGCELNDVSSAIKFLRSAQTAGGEALVGENIGIYGIELGALTGLAVAAADPSVKAIALESMPKSSSDLIGSVIYARFPFGSFVTAPLARLGSYVYYATSCFERASSCELAGKIADRNVLLLAGPQAPYFQTSTSNLSSCFPKQTKVQAFTDLTPSGFDLTNATLKQADFYDNRVIFFFQESLAN